MKKIKNKTMLYIILTCIIVLLIGGLAIFEVVTKEEKEKIDNYYTLYLKNNEEDILKLNLHEGYILCKRFNKEKVCSDKIFEVNEVTVYNTELNDEFISNNTVINSINEFIENNDLENVVIISDYKFNENDFLGKFFYEKELTDDNTTYYTVTFDTDGGSSIDSVVVKAGEKLNKPSNPSKDGYSFVNWEVDGEEFNFDNTINNDLTLKAIWEKNSTTSGNGGSTSGGNNTTSKINLNNNISATVYTKSTGNESCFFYMYPTNLDELFPSVKYETYSGINKASLCPFPKSDCLDTELALEDLDKLSFNTGKENTLENTLNKYDNTAGFNLINFTNNNHKISLEYEYITFNGLNVLDGTTANQEIQNNLRGAFLLQGPCGGFDLQENVTVDEKLCAKFNLDCGRW